MNIKSYFSSIDGFCTFLQKLNTKKRQSIFKYLTESIRKRLCLDIKKHKGKISLEELNLHSGTISETFETERLIFECDKYLQNIYNVLGSGDVKLDPVQWDIDFKTGKRWPAGTFYLNYRQEVLEDSSDVKVPRELSRCHHLLHCAIAYKVTKNKKYSDYIKYQISSWLVKNPLMYSINWGCAMDVAIRSVNWIWALSFINETLTEKEYEVYYESLYEHGWFIYNNLENGGVCNHNHYVADLSGLLSIGLLFKNTIRGRKWLDFSIKELFREMRYEVLPSGMTYERSTHYNRLVLELLLIPILELKKIGYEIPQDIEYRLENMFEFIMYSLPVHGISPIVGDQDNGRLLPMGTEELTNFKYLLSIGGLLFKRTDLWTNGNGYNIYCQLLLPDKKQLADELESYCKLHKDSIESKAFPDAGFYVLRHNNNHLFFNASGKGLYPEIANGGHTHSDLLSYTLTVNGVSFIVDPGSYVYTADSKERLFYRSTECHNTITVDHQSQNNLRIDELWTFDRDAIPSVLDWQSRKEKDYVSAQHNGYSRLLQSVIHTRNIDYDKKQNIWRVTDKLDGFGKHFCECNISFDEGVCLEITNTGTCIASKSDTQISLAFKSNSKFQLTSEKVFISKSYGERVETIKLKVSLNMDGNTTLETIIKQISKK